MTCDEILSHIETAAKNGATSAEFPPAVWRILTANPNAYSIVYAGVTVRQNYVTWRAIWKDADGNEIAPSLAKAEAAQSEAA